MMGPNKSRAQTGIQQPAQASTQFKRAIGLWYPTKADKIGDPTHGVPVKNNAARNRLAKGDNSFMHVKRQNPNQSWGSSDKHFKGGGVFTRLVPGLKHAHLAHDLNLVYLVKGNTVYLFGVWTHDELGTGTPPNPRRQQSMATQFANATFAEDIAAGETTWGMLFDGLTSSNDT